MIDWRRMAKPQGQNEDFETWRSDLPMTVPPASWSARLLGIPVVIGIADQKHPDFSPAQPEDVGEVWQQMQARYLSQWSAGAAALRNGIDEIQVFKANFSGRGCYSDHAFSRDPLRRTVVASMDDPGGCAEAIYHEAGHLRLEQLGVEIETHDGQLLTNPDDSLFDSPIRTDKPRPMSAILHGLMSWMWFTENDLQNFNGGVFTLEDFRGYSAHQLPKIEACVREIEKHAHFTPDGLLFIDGLFAWCDELLTASHAILDGAR